MEAGDAGAAEEVEEEGLDGVVAMVGGDDCVVAVGTAEVGEEIVAKVAGSLFVRHMVGGCIGTGVEVGGVEVGPQLVGEATAEVLVAVAVAGAQVEVDVGDGEGVACLVHEVSHADGVAAATDGEQHPLSLTGKEVLLFDVCLQLFQHQRRIILRI